MKKRELLTIQQTADVLGVSNATIRNWIKSGRIVNNYYSGKQMRLSRQEIIQLKKAIDLGEVQYLKSRRNKQAVSGFSIPDSYLDNQHQKLAHQLLLMVEQLNSSQRLLILLELYLRLLWTKGDLNNNKHVISFNSLVYQWLTGKLALGVYHGIAAEFYDLVKEVDKTVFSVLAQVSQLEINYNPGEDLLGLVYMSICSMGTRKAAGSYYTSTDIAVELIKDSMSYLKSDMPIIIDPCCGSGNFLLQLFLVFKDKLRQAGYSDYIIERNLLTFMLNGYDNDPVAVVLTKMNLSLLCTFPDLVSNLRVSCQDTLAVLGDVPKFDLIIGNPPWGYKFSRDEAKLLANHYYTAGTKGGVESYNLFIECAINQISDNGIISYILPEAFLTVRLHARARELILKNCRINKVTCFGTIFPEVNSPVISLVMQRTDKSKQNNVRIKTDGKDYQVSQAYFSNMDFSFNVFGSKTDYEIIHHLRREVNVQYLKGNADFALGIVTGNNKKYVLKQPQANSELVITGRNVFKYRIKPGGSYLVYQRDRFQQVASDHLYRADEKLLYRFINSRLVFAYDDNQLLSLNSANILIPRFSNMSIKYVLAVLNSRIAQFYHAVTNPAPKVLRSQLETIPICVCSKKQENIIVELVNSIIMSEKPAQRREIYEEIDRKLMNYYMLPAKYQAYIRRKNQIVELL